MKFRHLGFGMAAVLVGNAAATTLFSDNFESGLGAWSPSTYYAGETAYITADPLQGDHAVTFAGLNSGGDIITTAALTSATGHYIIGFDYLGLAKPGSVPGDLGGFQGISYGYPGSHFWLAGTIDGYAPTNLIDDGSWHHYEIAFDAGAGIHVMFEDFIGSSGVAGDAFFDNVVLTDGNGPSTAPGAVPEPSTLALLGLGLAGLLGGRTYRKARVSR